MSRLDQEHDVVALARELGLRGDPVEAVAFQLEHEDEQLKDWRKKMEKLRADEQGK